MTESLLKLRLWSLKETEYLHDTEMFSIVWSVESIFWSLTQTKQFFTGQGNTSEM